MKDANDLKTIELPIEAARLKRGRPATGKAMSSSERKRQSRARAWDKFLNLEELETLPTTAICEFLPRAVASGLMHCASEWTQELIRRTRVNQRGECDKSRE